MGQSAPSIDGEKPTGFWALRRGHEALEFVEPILDQDDLVEILIVRGWCGRVLHHQEAPVRRHVILADDVEGRRDVVVAREELESVRIDKGRDRDPTEDLLVAVAEGTLDEAFLIDGKILQDAERQPVLVLQAQF